MSILKKIIESKKKNLPSKSLWSKREASKSIRDFRDAIQGSPSKPIHLIGELKRKSPSKGEINLSMTVQKALDLYSPYASAVSILTESDFFGGSLNDLHEANGMNRVPLLRKDFIIDPIQVKEARYYGADSYLLIVAALSKNQLTELVQAGAEYDMPPLVEVHDERELEIALDIDIPILGINNRNLNDLTIDIENTHRLIERIPDRLKTNLIIISESGFHDKEGIDSLPSEVDAVLMGTSFMIAQKPEELLKNIWG